MELPSSNLYTTGRIINFPDGRKRLIRGRLSIEPSTTDMYYIVKPNDMFDDIAWRAYRDLVDRAWLYWWVITDINKVKNPLDMQPWIGKEIVVPNLQRVLLKLQ